MAWNTEETSRRNQRSTFYEETTAADFVTEEFPNAKSISFIVSDNCLFQVTNESKERVDGGLAEFLEPPTDAVLSPSVTYFRYRSEDGALATVALAIIEEV